MEGRALQLRRPKQRALLAVLLLHAGEVVSTDRLIEELWAGKPPRAAVGSLQNLISDLRKALGRELVRTRQPGYVLDIEPEQVDLHRFERLVAQASEGGDPERRSELLREALGLWRGPPLADLALRAVRAVEMAESRSCRTAAREALDRHRARARPPCPARRRARDARRREPAARAAARAVDARALPLRDGRQRRSRRTGDARRTLVEELGIDPSPELQRLEQAVLRHDQELDLPTRVAPPPAEPERRKTVTILFTDLVDSTSLSGSSRSRGDARRDEALLRHGADDHRAARRNPGEVHRRCRNGCLRNAATARGRCVAGRTSRVRAPRSDHCPERRPSARPRS